MLNTQIANERDMIPYIEELNFPKQNGQQYATLSQATVNLTDMAEKSISTQVKIDGDIAPDFSYDWAVKYHGEKYIMPLRRPQCTKGNDSINSIIDLTFQHWAIYQLKRWPFVTIQQIEAGTYLADDEEATVQLNLGDFCELLGQVLHYYFAGAITVDLNPQWEYDKTAKLITISHTKIWNVLTDALYKQYGARWEIQAASNAWEGDNNGERYVIRVGYSTTEVNHIFEYGFEGGLLKIEQQIQSEEIRNILKGRGGEKNLPRYYFKRVPDAEKEKWGYSDDPDWVVELKDIYFTRLMPATFRSYVQGWKAAHINQKDSNGKKLYDGYTAVGEENAYSAWAYRKGYTDTKFQPIEFVADEITLTPESEDKQVEVLPGYAPYVKKDSSIWKYGPLSDTLDSDDEVYPTLQGTKFDIAVAVEQIESDDIVEKAENNAKIRNYDGASVTTDEKQFNSSTSKEFTIIVPGPNFIVNEGDSGVLEIINVTLTSKNYEQVFNYANKRIKDTPVSDYELVDYEIEVVAGDGSTQTATGITPGTYTSRIKYNVRFKGSSPVKRYTFTASYGGANLITSNTAKDEWQSTFDIWVKNIWGSTQGEHEADSAYGERVWKPILGDREGDTAKVVFTSGALAVSEDYEFTIVGYPKPDSSKTWQEKDGIGNVTAVHTSHWRITLAKSDAEMEATGQYVPSTKKQGKAGDRFVFIGTEMMHNPYVTNAEVRLADNNKDALKDVKDIKPTYVVTLDRIRLNQQDIKDDTRLRYLLTEQGGYVHTEQGGRIALEGTGYASLLELLRPGCTVSLADKRFIAPVGNIAYEKLYVQSITFTYRQPSKEDAALNPDAEITLGNDYATSANPVSMMQGDISDLQRQVGAISNVEQIVRAVGDKLYLRKDGIDDRSLSPTQFVSLLTSGDFRSGIVGGAGWGFFKDENNNWVLETDRINVRQEMQVDTLVINQAEGRGGMEIDTAAYIEGVTRVDDTADGYVCYFDQKEGTVANLFHVGDVAYCQRWTPKNSALKFYKRRVTAVGVDHIVLAKTSAEGGSTPAEWTDSGVNGSGVPEEGDNIIHFGSYTDATRRYVKVRDVVGGGYERYLEGLSSVNSSGVEYYFVGRLSGTTTTGTPRWFIGNKDLVPNSGEDDGSYIEYKDREFNLHNVKLSVGTKLGDKPIGEYITDTANELLVVEYSATGADGTWHSTYTNGDRYMRQSSDGGNTWSGAMLVVAKDGDDGTSVSITATKVEYATGSSATVAPTSGWGTAVPAVPTGQYLWTRTTVTYSDGKQTVSYGVSRQGEDGAGYMPNLIRNSRFSKRLEKWSYWGSNASGIREVVEEDGRMWAHIKNAVAMQGLQQGSVNGEIPAKENTTYTLSGMVRSAVDGQKVCANIHGISAANKNVFAANTQITAGTTARRFSKTFTTSAGVIAFRLMIGVDVADLNDVYITDLKIEEGRNPNPAWSPHPDEMVYENCNINNLLRNSDFSKGKEYWTFTRDWATIDTTELFDGRFSLKIDTTANQGGYPGAQQDVIYDGEPTEITASVYVMMKDVTQRKQNIFFEVHCLDESGGRIGANQRIVNPTFSGEWQRFVFHFTTVPGTKRIQVFCWSGNYQVVWYNGMKLEFGHNENPIWTPNAEGMVGASIVTSVARDSFTEAQWTTYGTYGHAENWPGTENTRNGCRVGDLFTVVGRATDTGNGHQLTYRSDTDSGRLHGMCIAHMITSAGKDAPYTVFQWAKGDYAQPTGAWSDTPLNAAAGEYVWMRSGTVTPPATAPTSWGTPIRLTGDTGKAGGDALLLDLDNEVVAVTCDADGNVISGLPATITARVFKGGTELTSGVTYRNQGTTLTVSQSGNKFEIKGIGKDRDTLVIEAVVAGLTLRSTVTVYKVKPGEDGAPATMYFLEPAESSVTRTAQGGLSVTSLGCRKLYVTGSDQRHLTTANTLTAQIYTNGVAGTETVIAADGVTNNGVVTLTDDTTAVVFTLYKGASTAEADMLDRERVPVLTDAFGLSVGGVNLLRKTNSGITNWTTNTSSNGQIVMEPGTPQSRCVFYNNATTAAPDWQMIGFALPADTIKANCYYMLSFKARVLQSNGTAGGALTQPLQLRWQISKSTGGDRLTNVESRTVTYTETRFTIMMRTTGVPTSQHRLWGYISTTGTAWEALEIWDMQLEEGVVATEYKASPLDFNYLTEALKESTTVEGGVILSSLMRLGYTASDAYRVTAGMNGVLAPSTDGTDPAIWAGGDMLDATSDENSSADLDSLAKLMFRHNGNGYMCGGVVRVLDGRILIGRNRKADGTIKSDAEFAQDCIILDEEGLTYVSGGQDRLLVTSAQVGDTFETKVNAVNWSGTATAFDSIALAHYYSKEMILEPVNPEQTASEDGTEALSTTYLETWSWVPTINIAQTKTINIGSETIAVGTVIEVSSLSTSFSITRSHSEGVQITATAELCYTDSAGKVQVVRKVNMPKQYSGNTCSFSMGTTIRHTVQVAASYFVRLTLTPNTDGMGKPLANEYKTVTPATATASGTTKTTRSDVTIIGTDGIKSIWGDGGFLANRNGVKIRGSLWINGKLVTTS